MTRPRFPALAALLLLALIGPRALPTPAASPPLAFAASRPEGHSLRGVAVVTDGDTLRLGGTKIRLFGIDAPESHQSCPDRAGNTWPCGTVAAERLEALVANRVVDCELQDADRYGRMVASCSVDGRDLGATIVADGLARAYARYSDRYLPDEAEARAAGRGLWQAETEAPWDWRRDRGKTEAIASRAPAPVAKPQAEASTTSKTAAATPEPGCEIKGNIGGNGRKLYHTPEMASWSRTRIDPTRGERFFCDEAAALAAGWLPASGGRTKAAER
ncbi:MAG: thermonuclease family protein [Amaricoccus sp.]|uniref:thermonuclease family protein n=1 Tax=Amaricoccus sp. TaxID=1872485 RepID=UPI0039E21F92